MEELLAHLSRTALMEQAVAAATLDNGLRLFVYPQDGGTLVAIGLPAASGRMVQGEALLRRRSADMGRFGAWLPALFNDGGWYLLRRCGGAGAGGGDAAPLSQRELDAAEELLQ